MAKLSVCTSGQRAFTLYSSSPGTWLTLHEIHILTYNFICNKTGIHGLGCESTHALEILSLSENFLLAQTKT